MRRRAPSVAVLAAGIVLVAAVQLVAPVAAPLFDGVVVTEPYRYVEPPSGAAGSPTSADETVAIAEGASPPFAVFTAETPPQGELLAKGGELAITADSTSVRVTIDPIAPSVSDTPERVAGNIYRVAVTDQAGTPLAVREGETVTLALRGPAGIATDAPIARLEAGTWNPLPTGPTGLPDFLLTNVTAFGDFAILSSVTPAASDESPILLVAALVVAAVIAFFGLRESRGGATADGAAPARPGGAARRRRPGRARNGQDRPRTRQE